MTVLKRNTVFWKSECSQWFLYVRYYANHFMGITLETLTTVPWGWEHYFLYCAHYKTDLTRVNILSTVSVAEMKTHHSDCLLRGGHSGLTVPVAAPLTHLYVAIKIHASPSFPQAKAKHCGSINVGSFLLNRTLIIDSYTSKTPHWPSQTFLRLELHLYLLTQFSLIPPLLSQVPVLNCGLKSICCLSLVHSGVYLVHDLHT